MRRSIMAVSFSYVQTDRPARNPELKTVVGSRKHLTDQEFPAACEAVAKGRRSLRRDAVREEEECEIRVVRRTNRLPPLDSLDERWLLPIIVP
jgi:hypothetical protein